MLIAQTRMPEFHPPNPPKWLCISDPSSEDLEINSSMWFTEQPAQCTWQVPRYPVLKKEERKEIGTKRKVIVPEDSTHRNIF